MHLSICFAQLVQLNCNPVSTPESRELECLNPFKKTVIDPIKTREIDNGLVEIRFNKAKGLANV